MHRSRRPIEGPVPSVIALIACTALGLFGPLVLMLALDSWGFVRFQDRERDTASVLSERLRKGFRRWLAT